MDNKRIPFFCKACIERFQRRCPHLHTSFDGGLHYSGGDVWDDIVEICDDCGANLDALERDLEQNLNQDQKTEDIPF